MAAFDESKYGPTFAGVLQIDRLRPLDEGHPDAEVRNKLETLTPSQAFAHAKVIDSDMARCCLAGVWLLHDFLDESHTVSQGITTTSGSFWHGIMHRREGDFSNSKYWFRKVGDHPVYGQLAEEVRELGEENLLSDGMWDPFSFVDACQSTVRSEGSDALSCQRVQQSEWELLFDYCYWAATGNAHV